MWNAKFLQKNNVFFDFLFLRDDQVTSECFLTRLMSRTDLGLLESPGLIGLHCETLCSASAGLRGGGGVQQLGSDHSSHVQSPTCPVGHSVLVGRVPLLSRGGWAAHDDPN